MSVLQKRALHDAMEALDGEAESGNVNGGAHLRLSKALKTAYDAELDRPHIAIASYLVMQTVDDPNSLAYVPRVYRGLTDRPHFIRRIVTARWAKVPPNTHTKANRKWVKELLESLFCEEMLDEDKKDFSMDWFRDVLEAVLEADVGLYPALERHLDSIEVSPFHVCACGKGTLDVNNMPRALELEPRMLWWMLNPRWFDDFKYEPWEVTALQRHAFAHQRAEKCDDNVRFAHALGLRGPDDLVRLNTLTDLFPDRSFSEIRVLALKDPYPNAPEVKRTAGVSHWPWQLCA